MRTGRVKGGTDHAVELVWARDLRSSVLVVPVVLVAMEVIIMCTTAVLGMVVLPVVVLVVLRCAVVVGRHRGMVGIDLSMMKRPSVVVSFMMLVAAMGTGLTALVGVV